MIEIIEGCHRADPLIAAMLAERKSLFVDLLGWDVPIVDERFEIDVYDGDDAIYLIATDAAREHLGSLRLLPTIGAHLLADLFGPLCTVDMPRGAHVFEITRLCLPQRLGAAGRLRVRNRLISAMVDHALGRGISVFTGVVSASYCDQVLGMGWRCAPLGPARLIRGQSLGAFRLEIDAETPTRLASNGIYSPGMAASAIAKAA